MTHRLYIPMIGFLAFVILAASVAGMTHANTKHAEAPLVRASVRQGMCQAKEIWFAPTSGRILFLCQMEQNPQLWGGWVVFVAQNNGTELIQPHEATVFIGSQTYWRGVIERDHYMLAFNFPAVLDHATDVLGVQTP